MVPYVACGLRSACCLGQNLRNFRPCSAALPPVKDTQVGQPLQTVVSTLKEFAVPFALLFAQQRLCRFQLWHKWFVKIDRDADFTFKNLQSRALTVNQLGSHSNTGNDYRATESQDGSFGLVGNFRIWHAKQVTESSELIDSVPLIVDRTPRDTVRVAKTVNNESRFVRPQKQVRRHHTPDFHNFLNGCEVVLVNRCGMPVKKRPEISPAPQKLPTPAVDKPIVPIAIGGFTVPIRQTPFVLCHDPNLTIFSASFLPPKNSPQATNTTRRFSTMSPRR